MNIQQKANYFKIYTFVFMRHSILVHVNRIVTIMQKWSPLLSGQNVNVTSYKGLKPIKYC